MKWIWGLWLALPVAAQVVPDQYIVELEGQPAAVVGSRESRAVRERRAEIRRRHVQTGADLNRLGGKVLATVENVANALIVDFPSDREQDLWSIPGVTRVSRVWKVKLLLDRAAAIHRITDAWSRLPAPERAGAGTKIGIIDSGIDPDHPAFDDPDLERPAGYPLPAEGFPDFLKNKKKIIAARSYESLVRGAATSGVQDTDGHGTAVAMAAAGKMVSAPLATISGSAPKAWLGVYRVSFDNEGTSSTGAILKALDDAVADGMDVLNLSIGRPYPLRPEVDNFTDYMTRAEQAGVIVVAAAGNEGPWLNSMSSPATVPTVLAVGASSSDRMFATAVRAGDSRYISFPTLGPWPTKAVSGPLVDAETVDPSGLLCSPPPAGSLEGKLVLILRGTCFFEDKLNNAAAGGAVGAIVYTDAARPDLIRMSVGSATLPAQSLSYKDGIALKERIKSEPGLVGTLDPGPEWIPLDPLKLVSFSSAGPNADYGIKPDLVAVGANVYTAVQTGNPSGELYDASGYVTTEGTSFSAPVAAGAIAVLKSARPGLKPAQYRSLLVNSATPILAGSNAAVQRTGAGLLNLDAAMRSTVTVAPVSLSFGVVSSTAEQTKTLTVTNAGTAEDTITITVEPNEGTPAPRLSVESFTLAPGASREVSVTLSVNPAEPGQYQGFLVIRPSASDVAARVPFWAGVAAPEPSAVRVLDADTSGAPGALLRQAVLFQVVDASGIGFTSIRPEIVSLTGGGRAASIISVDAEIPGAYVADIRLGPLPGDNQFRIEVGPVSTTFTIRGALRTQP